jgi:hypothetical protein
MTLNNGKGTDPTSDGPAQTLNGLAVASLVPGLAWLMWIGSILALVFGYTARSQIDRAPHPQTGRGLAVAAIVLVGRSGIAHSLGHDDHVRCL